MKFLTTLGQKFSQMRTDTQKHRQKTCILVMKWFEDFKEARFS